MSGRRVDLEVFTNGHLLGLLKGLGLDFTLNAGEKMIQHALSSLGIT